VLARLLRPGSAPAAAWKERAAAQQLGARVRAEAERIVAGRLARGRLSLEEGLGRSGSPPGATRARRTGRRPRARPQKRRS
jgi:hypothetical protein